MSTTAANSKVPVTATTAYATPSTATQLTTALVTSGSIPTIQATLLHELQASGWTATLRTYIIDLMRKGECTKYDDLMDRVLEEALKDVVATKARANGAANGSAGAKDKERDSLVIPDAAIREGIKVVKRELEKVCEVA